MDSEYDADSARLIAKILYLVKDIEPKRERDEAGDLWEVWRIHAGEMDELEVRRNLM